MSAPNIDSFYPPTGYRLSAERHGPIIVATVVTPAGRTIRVELEIREDFGLMYVDGVYAGEIEASAGECHKTGGPIVSVNKIPEVEGEHTGRLEQAIYHALCEGVLA